MDVVNLLLGVANNDSLHYLGSMQRTNYINTSVFYTFQCQWLGRRSAGWRFVFPCRLFQKNDVDPAAMEPDGEIQPVDQPDTVTQVPAESSAATIVEDDAGALQDQSAQHSESQYAFYQHDFTSSPAQLLATTGSKYNTSIVQTLEDKKDILQQRIHQFNIHDGNNHFRNVKW